MPSIEIPWPLIIIIVVVVNSPTLLLPLLTGVVMGMRTHRVRRGLWVGVLCGVGALAVGVLFSSALFGQSWVVMLLIALAGSAMAVAAMRGKVGAALLVAGIALGFLILPILLSLPLLIF